MDYIFAPGCALTIENSSAVDRLHQWLNQHVQEMEVLEVCCRNHPKLPAGAVVINGCAGCDRRYRENYEHATTISLWEIIDQENAWEFPDYLEQRMSVHDPCPIRSQARVHNAVRSLLKKMNINVVEAPKIKNKSVCCGDSAWGKMPSDRIKLKMKKRADQMPEKEIVVSCVSCIKSIHIGGKRPRHIVDLLFGEKTRIGEHEPDIWHSELEKYVKNH